MLLNLLLLKDIPIFKQLEIEEALLRADTENWCLINRGSPPAIVMGMSGKKEELVNESHFLQNPIPLIRRFSGGGTVVVNEETFFVSFIFQKSSLDFGNCPQKVMQWSKSIYAPVLPFLDVRENDYVKGEKKIGGNAQYFMKDRWLHHTTFLWDYKKELMQLLQMPAKQPTYRQQRSHEEFITTLKGHFESLDALEEMLLHSLSAQFTIHKKSEDQVKDILLKPHRKALELVV